MDEDQHHDRFGMDGDFDDGQFIDGEFYYRNKKDKRKQTKEDNIYGVFNESDSDDDGGSKKKRKDGPGGKKDYTKPVAFVSTGIVKPAEEVDKQLKREEDQRQDEADGRGGLGSSGMGLGFSGGRAGLKEEDEDNILPTAFGQRIMEGAEKRREREKQEKLAAKKGSGGPSGVKLKGPGGAELGGFEKHTKGIGQKLLEKMGYTGGGLGKNKQGMAVPVEAKLRPKNMGMGFGDYSERSTSLPAAPGGEAAAEGAVEEEKKKPVEKLWKKSQWKVKRVYKPAEQLLEESEGKRMETTTVLDMRGPQVRVLTNLDALNEAGKAAEDDTPMPELQHNLRLIVDLAEAEILTTDRKLRHARDSVAVLHRECEELRKDAGMQDKQIKSLEAVLAAVESAQQGVAAGKLTLEALADIFENLQAQFRDEYQMYNVPALALQLVLPLMVAHFQTWDPLVLPAHGVGPMGTWQPLLTSEGAQQAIFQDLDSDTDCYTSLVRETVLPRVRLAVSTSWEPRDAEPMLRFMEAWDGLLPHSVRASTLDHLIMPRLALAVDAWDPRLETIPIHAWLHPWLPLLGARLEPLYPPVAHKIGAALHAWHPGDASAFALLGPWQAVFDAPTWEGLLRQCILPKLMYALQKVLQINPHHEVVDPFNWVMQWAGAVPTNHMVTLLETAFFPKWLQVLFSWLSAGPNFDEVTRWYLGWKGLFPQELLAHERVRRHLNAALDMMNQAVAGAPVVEPAHAPTLQPGPPPMPEGGAATAGTVLPSGIDVGATMSLKEVVEAFAQEHDIQFLPKPGRVHQGLQVYGFGTVSMVVDTANQVLAAQLGDHWAPLSLEQLLEAHRARTPGTRWG